MSTLKIVALDKINYIVFKKRKIPVCSDIHIDTVAQLGGGQWDHAPPPPRSILVFRGPYACGTPNDPRK